MHLGPDQGSLKFPDLLLTQPNELGTNSEHWIANIMRVAVFLATLLVTSPFRVANAQQTGPASQSQADTDHDGLGDQLEQSLLTQFAPRFMIGRKDCANFPAEFRFLRRPLLRPRQKLRFITSIYGARIAARMVTRSIRSMYLFLFAHPPAIRLKQSGMQSTGMRLLTRIQFAM